jgi:hypothetical protein
MSARFQDQTLEPDQTAVKARRVGSSYGGTRENFRDNFGERYFSGKTRGVAVETVIGEPVSELGIPCSAGKYREFLPLKAQGGRWPRISEQIQSVSSKFPKNRNREFRGLNRELPVA